MLLVPSVATGGREQNVLLNPAYPDFAVIAASDPEPLLWDERLFRPVK